MAFLVAPKPFVIAGPRHVSAVLGEPLKLDASASYDTLDPDPLFQWEARETQFPDEGCFPSKDYRNVEGDRLSPLPEAVARAVCKDENFVDCDACEPVGMAIDLGRAAYVFTTSDSCNWTVSMGPIWIVVTQPKPVVVLFAMGNSLNLGSETRNGMKSVSVGAGTAGWSRTQQWEFDGERYVMVSEIEDTEEPDEADKPVKPHKPAKPKRPKKGKK